MHNFYSVEWVGGNNSYTNYTMRRNNKISLENRDIIIDHLKREGPFKKDILLTIIAIKPPIMKLL